MFCFLVGELSLLFIGEGSRLKSSIAEPSGAIATVSMFESVTLSVATMTQRNCSLGFETQAESFHTTRCSRGLLTSSSERWWHNALVLPKSRGPGSDNKRLPEVPMPDYLMPV